MQALTARANDGLRASPEHSMVYEQQVGACSDGAVHRIAGKIDSCRDALDVAGVRELDAVDGVRIVRNADDVQHSVEKLRQHGEGGHRQRFAATLSRDDVML